MLYTVVEDCASKEESLSLTSEKKDYGTEDSAVAVCKLVDDATAATIRCYE